MHDPPTGIEDTSGIAVCPRHLCRGKSDSIGYENLVFRLALRMGDQSRLNDLDERRPVIRLEQQRLKACPSKLSGSSCDQDKLVNLIST